MSRRTPALRPKALAAFRMLLAAAMLLVLLPHEGDGGTAAALDFVRDGQTRTVGRDELAATCGVTRISIDDPYYGRAKSYLACPLRKVLERGFGVPAADLAKDDLVFRAADGYAKPSPGARAVEDGGWLAFSDADRGSLEAPAWEPIDRRQVDPAPFYVVWSGKAQRDTHAYPWPYQLVKIERTSVARTYPRTVPSAAAAGSAELAGFEVFKTDCIACHAMNGQGGKVGPDLNVPQSIVEYRPEAQIRQYIRNPATFRYSSMPAHEHLSDTQLDALIAYFRAMSRDKHDPGKPS
jgi:mono/diheme cytochrome c family protein